MKPSRVSILYFDNARIRAGVEEHILVLLRGLDRKCFRLLLACTPELAEKMRTDVPRDVEIIPLRLEGARDLTGAWRLARLVRERRPDVLHTHLFQASRLASPLAWLCGVPLVVETPHLREEWRKGWLQGSFVIDRLAGRFVDYYIAVSEANAHYLKNEKGLPARKIVTIQNGGDLARFDPARVPPAGMKRNLGFSEDDPVVVVLARLEPQKGHDVLLQAWPAVMRKFPSVRLVCVGEGASRAELEALAGSLGLEGSVRFVGYQSNPADWLALAHFTVLPSRFEGLPIAAIESLAMGKSMVATDVDGTGEVVINGKTGVTVPPGQPGRLAEAVCLLLADPDLRQRLGEAGRAWVVQRFSQERQVQMTAEFYLRALRRSVSAGEGDEPTQAKVEECACAGTPVPAERLASGK
ncbi:MAG TPA: glycosyltransferase [Terriglobales bacterium]